MDYVLLIKKIKNQQIYFEKSNNNGKKINSDKKKKITIIK